MLPRARTSQRIKLVGINTRTAARRKTPKERRICIRSDFGHVLFIAVFLAIAADSAAAHAKERQEEERERTGDEDAAY